jgi:hypothetical protein
MGEWSERFEDFPNEGPAKQMKNGRFDPEGVKKAREAEARKLAIAKESEALQKKRFQIADDAKKAAKKLG